MIMKDFMYLLVTLIITGFAIGLAYLQVVYGEAWFLGFIPLTFLFFVWGLAIIEEYSSKK